jgi:CDGSH-type Zn-finger protein
MEVIVKPKGPIVIEGPVTLRDPEGNEIVPPPKQRAGRIKLCGCGRSKIRPFCDGSHKETDDQAV